MNDPTPGQQGPAKPEQSSAPVAPSTEGPTQPTWAPPAPVDGESDPWADVRATAVANTDPRGRSRRTKVLVGALALALVGGTAYAGATAYGWFKGTDGARPESALPASTLALAVIDTDPAGSQKIDAVRFALKLPGTKKNVSDLTETSDWRKSLFEAWQKDGTFAKDVSYEADVAPWLGRRFAVALLAGEGGTPTPVVVVPVTDKAKATAGLAKLTQGGTDSCAVGEEFALCGAKESEATVTGALAAAGKGSLAQQKDFATDMSKVDTDALLSFWGDGGAMATSLPDLTTAQVPSAAVPSGRFVGGLRFDGPHLQLDAFTFGSKEAWAETPDDALSLGSLPAETVGAIGVRGAGAQLLASWPQLKDNLGSLAESFLGAGAPGGASVPQDLADALGSDTVVAFGPAGAGGVPAVAIRTNGTDAAVAKVEKALTGVGASAFVAQGHEGSGMRVLGLSQEWADAVAGGTGLEDVPGFSAALPALKDARVALFLKPEGLIAYEPTMDEETKAAMGAFAGLGMTVGGSGHDSEVHVRVVTK